MSAQDAIDALGVDTVPADVTPAPTPAIAGTFAIYEDGQGGFVLVTETPEHGVIRKHIPRALIKLVSGGGLLGGRIAGLFGGA